jgi:hypothetical protein
MFNFVSSLSEPISLAMLGVALAAAAFLAGRLRPRRSADVNGGPPFRLEKEQDAL